MKRFILVLFQTFKTFHSLTVNELQIGALLNAPINIHCRCWKIRVVRQIRQADRDEVQEENGIRKQ
jgi:hypothetical protein